MDGGSDDQGYQLFTEDDIVQHEIQQEVNDENDEEDESEESHTWCNIPRCGDAKDTLDKCLLWYERQDESTSTSLLLLKHANDLAATKRFLRLKQLKLDSFLLNLSKRYCACNHMSKQSSEIRISVYVDMYDV